MGGRGQSRVNGEGLQIWWAGWVDGDRADLMEKLPDMVVNGPQWHAMAGKTLPPPVPSRQNLEPNHFFFFDFGGRAPPKKSGHARTGTSLPER